MEKRLYQREKLDNVDAVFYIQGIKDGNNEFSGIATDISDRGLAIRVSDEKQIEIADQTNIGTVLRFVFVDEYDFFEEEKTVQVEGVAKIVRKEKVSGELQFGCEIPGRIEMIEQYVSDKVIVSFINEEIKQDN